MFSCQTAKFGACLAFYKSEQTQPLTPCNLGGEKP
jgi:hypothetical protein